MRTKPDLCYRSAPEGEMRKCARCGEWWYLLDGSFRVDRRPLAYNPARLHNTTNRHASYCMACEAEIAQSKRVVA